MRRVVITLEEKDLLDLQEILIDGDQAAALAFLRARVAPAIPTKGTAKCDSSRCDPYLLRPEKPKKTGS
jgi:hypothetical protein